MKDTSSINSAKKLIVILGPTATGKTDLALKLAGKIDGELISCDSRQVYKTLDIGSGKLPSVYQSLERGEGSWIIDGIRVWMYDIAEITETFTVNDYIKRAEVSIERVVEKGKVPIIVGGTGLYLKALLEGLDNRNTPADPGLRGELEKLSLEDLQKKLLDHSPITFNALNSSDKNNPRRLIRKIELVTMYPYIGTDEENYSGLESRFNILKIGLTAPRPSLNSRIDQRILSRIDQGLVIEVEGLLKKGIKGPRINELGLEYRYLSMFIENKMSLDQAVKLLMIKSHQYAKRQMTWFNKQSKIKWFDVTKSDFETEVEKLALDWYNNTDDQKN